MMRFLVLVVFTFHLSSACLPAQELNFEPDPETLRGRKARVTVTGGTFSVDQSPRLRIHGVTLSGIEPEVRGEELVYWLDREKVPDRIWERIHGRAWGPKRTLAVSLTTSEQARWMDVANSWVLWWFVGLLTFGGFLIVLLAYWTSVLRDAAPSAANAGPSSAHAKTRTFSLARFQFAWWTAVMVVAVVFLYVVRSEIVVSGSGVLMLSFAAGTVAGSHHIARARRDQERSRVQDSRTQIQDSIKALGRRTSKTAKEEKAQLSEEASRLKVRMAALSSAESSQGFLRDTMATTDGAQWHRLQSMTWSVVLGVLFLMEVYEKLVMPTLPPSLLALSGLSAATYIGMKNGEPDKHRPRAPKNRSDGPPMSSTDISTGVGS